MNNIESINVLIKGLGDDKNKISDGYHTFGELYEHRIELFITLARIISYTPIGSDVWKSRKHSDGSEWYGWFILGIGKEDGDQITYHLPYNYWNFCEFAETLEKAPEFDGHTSQDIIKRLQEL